MMLKQLVVNLGKLLLCSVAIYVGLIVGGIVATVLQLPPQEIPPGADSGAVSTLYLLETPLFALALALLARGLAGAFRSRALALAFFAWVAYSVNTVLEASIFVPSGASGALFNLVTFLFPTLLGGSAAAFLFPPDVMQEDVVAVWKAFFSRRTPVSWAWRLALAAVAFMPIYYFFGSLVYPYVQEYYQQNVAGLATTTGLEQLLPILLVRSVLFLFACLPILVMWRKSERTLFLSLGFALFTLVGLLYMLLAYWMPLTLRVPHTLEILADSFVYAGVLVLLLVKGAAPAQQQQPAAAQSKL